MKEETKSLQEEHRTESRTRAKQSNIIIDGVLVTDIDFIRNLLILIAQGGGAP